MLTTAEHAHSCVGCCMQVAPYDMSLSAVKKFIWCKSEDIIFNYRIFDPANPAPLPQIKPGKQ
jgi:hypothetical protein